MNIPSTMNHVVVSNPGPADGLELRAASTPEPGPVELLIKVASAGVNRPDILQRTGKYPPPPGASDILGLEVAGVVVAAGSQCTRYAVGDEVCALVASGGYADYAVAPEPQCLPVPDGVSLIEAGGLPETFFTVWSNLFDRAGLAAGETVLVHGGSSGIGTTAIQLAKVFGATVFVTAGSKEKTDACRELGADLAINYRLEDFEEAVASATSGRGVDVVLDMIGGDYTQKNLNSLADEGRLIQIAFLGGMKVQLNMRDLMTRRLTWTGSTLRPRSVPFKGAIAARLERQVWPLFGAGRIGPVVYATFPLAEASSAHRMMEESRHIGKILLLP
jgi:NADPH2:quinone reductase